MVYSARYKNGLHSTFIKSILHTMKLNSLFDISKFQLYTGFLKLGQDYGWVSLKLTVWFVIGSQQRFWIHQQLYISY